MSHRLKFYSSCITCITALRHSEKHGDKSEEADISVLIPSFSKELNCVDCVHKRARKICQGELVINENDKYCDINAKGHE